MTTTVILIEPRGAFIIIFMPAKDIYHISTRHALEHEGWVITHDPYIITSKDDDKLIIDLGAEMPIAAERYGKKIAVEIKSFINRSAMSDFHIALGQFMNYRFALSTHEPNRMLYLAITSDIYDNFFQKRYIQALLDHYNVKLIVIDPVMEVISKWID